MSALAFVFVVPGPPYGTMAAVASKVVPLREPASDRYADTLRALQQIATRIVGRDGEVEPADVAQDAFLRLRPQLDEGAELSRGYLWRTAYTVMIDMLRKERSEKRRRQQLTAVADPPPPSPETRVHGTQIAQAIGDCVERLERGRQSVVVLHLQGHGLKEISSLLAWPYKRVDNLLYRGLKGLRVCLESKGVTP